MLFSPAHAEEVKAAAEKAVETATEAAEAVKEVAPVAEQAAEATASAAAPAELPAAGLDAVQAAAAGTAEQLSLLASVSDSAVYLMGLSFVLGSLFTILVLILLDFMRRNAK